MPHVTRHCWTERAKDQVSLAKLGNSEISHPDELPLIIHTKKSGWLCRRVVVKTTERIWYRDAVTQIEVPEGFECDLASVPRALWCLVSPYDLAVEGILHDQLYRSQVTTRRYADFFMFHLMTKRGVPWYVRYPVWLAVRLGGRKAWDKHARRIKRDKSTK